MDKKSILLVDPDPLRTWNLCDTLRRAGHSVTDTPRPDYAREILQERAFEVAILDTSVLREDGPDLIDELRRSWARPQIIVMTGSDHPQAAEELLKRGAHHAIAKPVNVSSLLELISPRVGFSGEWQGIDILDFVQFLLISGKKTVVEVESPAGARGRFHLDSGNVLHAVMGDASGEQAFYMCMGLKEGKCVGRPSGEPVERTIHKPAEFLLFEAARRRDESQTEKDENG